MIAVKRRERKRDFHHARPFSRLECKQDLLARLSSLIARRLSKLVFGLAIFLGSCSARTTDTIALDRSAVGRTLHPCGKADSRRYARRVCFGYHRATESFVGCVGNADHAAVAAFTAPCRARPRTRGPAGALAAALAGQGSLVLIGGEAGIGKTALAEALCREAAEQGALVLVGRCYDLTETPPYGPGSNSSRRYQPTTPATGARCLRSARHGRRPSPVRPTLFQSVRDFFAALAGRASRCPLARRSALGRPRSLELVRFLARSLADTALLLLALYRVDELTRHHPFSALLPLLVRESAADAPRPRLACHDARRACARCQARYHLPSADEDPSRRPPSGTRRRGTRSSSANCCGTRRGRGIATRP